jgi:uncharacterized delta-60 repeat protein
MKKILLLATTILCFLNSTNAQPGQLDPSFGTNGIIKTDLGETYNSPTSGKLVLAQPDGSLYLILQTNEGNRSLGQTIIAKRNQDGSIDSNYGNNGYSPNVKMVPSSAVLMPDGKIVVAGSVDREFNNYDLALARYNANGFLDRTFGNDGIQKDFAFSTGNITSKIEVRQDHEKIVVSSGLTLSRLMLTAALIAPLMEAK